MKFLAKHPAGQTYELTHAEMQHPALISELGINELWTVHHGGEWIPMATFLGLSGGQFEPAQPNISDLPSLGTLAAGPLLAASAPWTPGSLFALILRLLGLYLVFEVLRSLLAEISGLLATPEALPTPGTALLPIAISYGSYLIVGLYLLAGPRALLAWIFRPA
jgi:hypothetical protein